MPKKFFRTAVEILAVALAYYGAARLALLLAIPPGYATAIWPSAGIALAALLFCGARVAPGIFLGSFFANLGTSYATADMDALLRSLILPMWIGIGAMAQGQIGAALIRRHVGFPTELVEARDTIKLLLIAGPVSCTVSPTVGALSLLVSEIVPLHSYAINWGIWWVGDTIGALIVMPLAFAWFGQPRTVWQRRSKIVALPLCIAFLATVGLFIGARGEFHAGGNSLLSWAVLAGGLGLTGMLGAFLLVISGQAMVAERLVAERLIAIHHSECDRQRAWESESKLRAIFDHAAVGMTTLSWPELRFLRVNHAFCHMTGYCYDELLQQTAMAITFPDDRQMCTDLYGLLMREEQASHVLEKRFVRKQGLVVWVRATVSPIRDANGAILYLMAVVEDITQAKHAEQARQDTERRLDLAIKIAQMGTWEWELATNAVFWSSSLKLQLGYEDSELPGSYAQWEARLHPEDRARVLDQLKHYFGQSTSDYAFEYRLRHRNGSYRWFQTRALPERGADGNVTRLIGIHLDVTEHKLNEQRTREAALHDSLTGLPGRTLILEYAGHLLASARRNDRSLALLFVDLDRFKAVNDSYGHEIGDHLLMEVAHRLLSCVRAEDLVGRLGGDEFVIVLPTIAGGDRAEVVARHLIAEIGKPFSIDSHVLSVSPSIGISQFPADGDDIDTLIHAADMAMYQVKQSGRASYQFGSPG